MKPFHAFIQGTHRVVHHLGSFFEIVGVRWHADEEDYETVALETPGVEPYWDLCFFLDAKSEDHAHLMIDADDNYLVQGYGLRTVEGWPTPQIIPIELPPLTTADLAFIRDEAQRRFSIE